MLTQLIKSEIQCFSSRNRSQIESEKIKKRFEMLTAPIKSEIWRFLSQSIEMKIIWTRVPTFCQFQLFVS